MKRLFPLACLLALTVAAPGEYIQPELKKIPLARLLANLNETAKANPADASVQHHLARTHAMAYSRKFGAGDKVESFKGWQAADPTQPWFGYEPDHVPFNKVAASNDPAKKKEAKAHLNSAIAHYKKALAAKPADTAIMLGLAWCQEQGGETKAAVAGYRAVMAAAWKLESKHGGGLGNFVYVETAGYLRSLLDAKKDAAELATIEARKKELLAQPRAITPLIVPVRREVTKLDSLLDPAARVRFDLDGSGRPLEWPWITTNAAWLVYDPGRTGAITSAIQMFGNRSFLLFCEDGYEALALLDDNHDGFLRGPELEGLALWHDHNSDGISHSGEVSPLTAHGITALSTRSEEHASGMPWSPSGVRFEDGTTRPTFDLILQSWPQNIAPN